MVGPVRDRRQMNVLTAGPLSIMLLLVSLIKKMYPHLRLMEVSPDEHALATGPFLQTTYRYSGLSGPLGHGTYPARVS